MEESVKQRLSTLLALLKNPDIKSKQAAFNACYNELTQLKEIASWETIVEVIEKETGISFDARTASNMYGRSRRKIAPKIKNLESTSIGTTEKLARASEDLTPDAAKKKVNNPGDLRKLRNRQIDLDDLKNGE